MNPEIDTKNKDATDVSSPDQPAGQPQQMAEPAPRSSTETKRTAHSVTVENLRARPWGERPRALEGGEGATPPVIRRQRGDI